MSNSRGEIFVYGMIEEQRRRTRGRSRKTSVDGGEGNVILSAVWNTGEKKESKCSSHQSLPARGGRLCETGFPIT